MHQGKAADVILAKQTARKEEANPMLFVALLMVRPGSSFKEGGARRIQRQYPEGVNVVGEYWLEMGSPRVIAIVETASMGPLGQTRMECADMPEMKYSRR
jgi:hypothetical protein